MLADDGDDLLVQLVKFFGCQGAVLPAATIITNTTITYFIISKISSDVLTAALFGVADKSQHVVNPFPAQLFALIVIVHVDAQVLRYYPRPDKVKLWLVFLWHVFNN